LVETNTTTTQTDTFTIDNQPMLQQNIADYYKFNIAGKTDRITDMDIDKFVAYIWTSVMQHVYAPIYTALKAARNNGNIEEAKQLYSLINAIKGWELGPDAVTFKDTDTITSMSEVGGSTLFDYIKYGLNYIKLVRNVLSYYVTKNLIDENGNITKYTNDNEIVQVVVPVESINLTVSLDSVLLTE
jgi:hypothetical protein